MKDYVEVFFHAQQPYIHVKEEDLEKYDSGRLGFPNTYFDPEKAHVLYNQYHSALVITALEPEWARLCPAFDYQVVGLLEPVPVLGGGDPGLQGLDGAAAYES